MSHVVGRFVFQFGVAAFMFSVSLLRPTTLLAARFLFVRLVRVRSGPLPRSLLYTCFHSTRACSGRLKLGPGDLFGWTVLRTLCAAEIPCPGPGMGEPWPLGRRL